MGFRSELSKWFDANGLMNTGEGFGVECESGNPLTETGMAYCLLNRWDIINAQDRFNLITAISKMRYMKGPLSLFLHKPGSTDQVTHDDLIGVVAAGNIVGPNYADSIVKFGEMSHWVLSNTDSTYWEAVTKPWHEAFYILAAGKKPGILLMISLFGMIISDAFSSSISDKRLTWMMGQAIGSSSPFISLAMAFWNYKIKTRFNGMKGIFESYYGINHIFTRYCPEKFV